MNNNLDNGMDIWLHRYNDLVRWKPAIAERVVSWSPCAEKEMMLYLDDGSKVRYDWYDNRLRSVRTKPIRELNDDEWCEMFCATLDRKMRINGITQEELSYRTGISLVSINRYVNKKAIPGGRNLYLIANAIGCTVDEIVYDYIDPDEFDR